MSDDPKPGDPEGQPDPALPQDDERLLADLRAVAGRLDPVPDEAVLAARSMLAYLRLDAELAELAFDSLVDEPLLAVRSEAGTARQLTFDAEEFQVEVEVIDDGESRRLVGQCIPAVDVELTVLRRDEGESDPPATPWLQTTSDGLGRFVIDVPAGQVSLRCRWPSTGRTIETAWVRI